MFVKNFEFTALYLSNFIEGAESNHPTPILGNTIKPNTDRVNMISRKAKMSCSIKAGNTTI